MRSYVPRAKVTKDHMWEVFHSVPKMRAMAVDNASYEELQALYARCVPSVATRVVAKIYRPFFL